MILTAQHTPNPMLVSGYYPDGMDQREFDRYWNTLLDDGDERCPDCGFILCRCADDGVEEMQ